MPCGSAKDGSQPDKNGDNGHCAFQDLDHSILQHSFSLGVTNVEQILKCIKDGSREIKDIILNECNIIYECKVCANLFRSLANFLYHKRCYCKKHLCEGMQLFENFEEEQTVVTVHPEPPDKESDLTQVQECTVNLVDEEVEVPKEKGGKNKGAKSKNPAVDQSKKIDIPPRTTSPMISRRTRLKNSANASKRALKFVPEPEPEPSKRSTKSLSKASASLRKASVEDTVKGNSTLNESKHQKKGKAADSGKVAEPVELMETDEGGESAKRSDSAKVGSPGKVKELSKETEEEVITLSDSDPDDAKLESQTSIKQELNSSIASTAFTPIEKPSKQMFVKPVKTRIVLKKPPAIQFKGGTILSNIHQSINTSKIGFTNITNASGKSLQCFPKIIFKTIDGNPHAVFQSTDSAKSDNIAFQAKTDGSKPDSDKLVIVLNNDVTAADTEQKSTPQIPPKVSKTPNEFHLTRRKRLLQRTDCNVADLKCLNCNAQFTSLKTLYFHMLSIHSKKRLYYPCPFCKTLFVQMYGVTRHLVSIHNKSKEQINKLREVIKKKSVWKKVEDVCMKDEMQEERNPSPVKEPAAKEPAVKEPAAKEPVAKEPAAKEPVKEEVPMLEVKTEEPQSEEEGSPNGRETIYKSPIKLTKDTAVHNCSKCGRAFGRKSSQVSHEKFCIMNAIKVDMIDLTGPISPPPNVSFLSLSPKKVEPVSIQPSVAKEQPKPLEQKKVSTRPKRGAEKQMHRDFVDSQTLKWRSPKVSAAPVKKPITKTIEKKVMNIMSVDDLLCTKCDKKFSSYSNLRRHVAIHVGWTRFKCKHCEYQAYNKSQCWTHVQKAHSVPEGECDKSVLNISKNPMNRISKGMPQSRQTSIKVQPKVPKKMKKRKTTLNGVKAEPEKKSSNVQKENTTRNKAANKEKIICLANGKEVVDSKEKHMIFKKEFVALRKEKGNASGNKIKFCSPAILKRPPPIIKIDDKKDTQNPKAVGINNVKSNDLLMLATPNGEDKLTTPDQKKTRPLGPIFKINVPAFKKEGSNYKTVTTNSPTTIILSKKFSSSPTVQSILAFPPESLSSNASSATKCIPIRTSPRKLSTEEKSPPSLVTRSTKGGQMPSRSNSTEEQQKSPTILQEKTYTKKDKLISEWFPKKDINSNARRESAPLIIGLVPAANASVSRARSPGFASDKNQN